MSFSWNDFKEIANAHRDDVIRDSTARLAEAKARTAIGRAYYAAFNVARSFAKASSGTDFRGRNTHQNVAGWFRDSADNSLKRVGSRLDHVRELRNRADYQKQYPQCLASMRSAMEESEGILEYLRQK